jgi:riboflavin synthase
MFTGIIEEMGRVSAVHAIPNGGQQTKIACSFAGNCHIDESISINGACHTVVDFDDHSFTVQSIEETLRKTTISELKTDMLVNLERSMTLQKGIEGHLVQGHVDIVANIVRITPEETGWLIDIALDKEYQDMIVGRGSITVDGISLTVAEDLVDAFRVAIIPYTWDHTNLATKKKGDDVNLEFDVIGKYVVKYLAKMNKK